MSTMLRQKLDPYHEIRTMMAIIGKKQRVNVSHVPSTINEGDLYVGVPNMGHKDVLFALMFQASLQFGADWYK